MTDATTNLTAARGDDELTLSGLEAVAAMLPVVLRAEARPGIERGGEPLPSGAIQMPYFEDSPEVLQVMSALGNHHVMKVFDWTTWQDEAKRFLDPAVVATASLDEVRRLLTLHVRKDRFCEGHFGAMVGSGHITALVRRLGEHAVALRAGAGRTRFFVEQADLTRVVADAIVNPTSTSLSGGGGLDAAIHRAAGPELTAACRAHGRCRTGEAVLTPGFRLPARHVIHAVGPEWRGGKAGEPHALASAYRASLTLALAHGCRTIAFPAISCGSYGYPLEAACTLAVATIRSWCDVHPGIDDVILVGYERAVCQAMIDALE